MFGRKDVHDHVAKIDENPGSIGVAFDAPHTVIVAAGAFDNRIGDCASLDLRSAAHDCKRIGQNGPAADVEHGKAFAFFVQRAFFNDVDQRDAETSGASISGGSTPKNLAAARVGGAAATPLRA